MVHKIDTHRDQSWQQKKWILEVVIKTSANRLVVENEKQRGSTQTVQEMILMYVVYWLSPFRKCGLTFFHQL